MDRTELTHEDGRQIILYSCFWSLMLLVMVPVVIYLNGEQYYGLKNAFYRILFTPCKLVTDYFELGSSGAAFLNAGLCGLACNLMMFITKAKPSATLLAGYFLVIAHCFYGLNLLNMWLPFLGIPLYCLVMNKPYGEHLHLSFFCTSLGPFISDFLFRYTIVDEFDMYYPRVTMRGIVIAIVFGLASGFFVPALLPGTTRMHRGFNLFKAGVAIGLYGIFAYALFYKTFGIQAPEVVYRFNHIYERNDRNYFLAADIFFSFMFLSTFLYGFVRNGKSLKGYRALMHSDGLNDDFTVRYGMPLTFINFGVCGMVMLLSVNLITWLTTNGVGFTGPTVGVCIASITFVAAGQTVRNVHPIVLGYLLFFGTIYVICEVFSMQMPTSISQQGYINGLAFATGLCPFSGRYGVKYGILAGAVNAIVCTSTSAMHGGLVLYNGGLAAGLTAMLLLPILDHYNVAQKQK